MIRMGLWGIGDILALTPVLEGLRRDHPTAMIELDTTFPELFVNNPHINKVHSIDRHHTEAYDRIIAISPDYQSYDLIAAMGEHQAATKLDSYLPQLFLSKREIDEAKEILGPLRKQYDSIACCSLLMRRAEWQGRNWNLEEARKLIQMLNEAGVATVEIGEGIPSTGEAALDLIGQTALRQLFAIIACSDLFIGIDSLPFHAAQGFQIPIFALFGATEPSARVIDFKTTTVIRREGLACLGCYHKPGAAPINRCQNETEDCMKGLTAERVFAHISGEINPLHSNSVYLQGRIRNAG